MGDMSDSLHTRTTQVLPTKPSYEAVLARMHEHELCMAALYALAAEKYPKKKELLLGMAREEKVHAAIVVALRRDHLDICVFPPENLGEVLRKIDLHLSVLEHFKHQVQRHEFTEDQMIAQFANIECSTAEIQVNAILRQACRDPRLDRFRTLIEGEVWHDKLLTED